MATATAPHRLTPSGKGLRIADRRITDFSVEEIRALVAEHEWLAFKDNPVSERDVIAFLEQFGSLVSNDRRQGAVLKLDGSRKEEVLLGEGFMPLHRDGALMGTNVALVGIYCAQYENVEFGGRAFVCDIANACKEVPDDVLALIRAHGIEGRPVDRYYSKAADVWHAIPGFIDVGGESFLNVGFPYGPGEKASWLVRIPGVDEDRFREVFDVLTRVLMSPKYCYFHEWEEGDVLLLDNLRTLHGREAFKGRRALSNIQVVAD